MTSKSLNTEPKQPHFCFVHFTPSTSGLEVTFQNGKMTSEHFRYNLEDWEEISDRIQTLLEQHSESAPTLVTSSILQLHYLNLHHTLNLFSGWLDLRTLVMNRNFANINAIRCQREEAERLEMLCEQFTVGEAEISETELMRQIMNKVLTSNPNLRLESFVQPIINWTKEMMLAVIRISFQTGGDGVTVTSLEFTSGPEQAWSGKSRPEQEMLEQFLQSLEKVKSDRGEIELQSFSAAEFDFLGNCDLVLLTMENDLGLAVLVSRLEFYQLIAKFLSAVILFGEKTEK